MCQFGVDPVISSVYTNSKRAKYFGKMITDGKNTSLVKKSLQFVRKEIPTSDRPTLEIPTPS